MELKSTLFDQDFNKNFDFNSRTIHLGITEILENVDLINELFKRKSGKMTQKLT